MLPQGRRARGAVRGRGLSGEGQVQQRGVQVVPARREEALDWQRRGVQQALQRRPQRVRRRAGARGGSVGADSEQVHQLRGEKEGQTMQRVCYGETSSNHTKPDTLCSLEQ